MPVGVGHVIAGKYRVERVIGEGGMGVVAAARHLALGELVAVKVIRREHAEKKDVVARFHREARAVARLRNEYIARVFDVDYLDDGAPYIVMEYLDGSNLDDFLEKNGPLDPAMAVALVTQACEGVAEAHAHGMVHRDLKLKNLHLGRRPDGRRLVKILDFGVVKLAATERGETGEPTITGSAVAVGTIHYMAPEQIAASNIVDARADVWSLGVCLYKLLTQKLPFPGDEWPQIVNAVRGRPPPRVDVLRPDIPAGLADVVERALEKSLKRRYQNVGELADAIAPFGGDAGAGARIAALLRGGAASDDPDVDSDVSAPGGRAHETAPHEREPLGDEGALGATRIGLPIGSPVGSTVDDAAATLPHVRTTLPPSGAQAKLAGAVLFLAAVVASIVLVNVFGGSSSPRPASENAPPPAETTIPSPTMTVTTPPPAMTTASTATATATVTLTANPNPAAAHPPARTTKPRRAVPEQAPQPPVTTPGSPPPAPTPTPTPTSPYDKF